MWSVVEWSGHSSSSWSGDSWHLPVTATGRINHRWSVLVLCYTGAGHWANPLILVLWCAGVLVYWWTGVVGAPLPSVAHDDSVRSCQIGGRRGVRRPGEHGRRAAAGWSTRTPKSQLLCLLSTLGHSRQHRGRFLKETKFLASRRCEGVVRVVGCEGWGVLYEGLRGDQDVGLCHHAHMTC